MKLICVGKKYFPSSLPQHELFLADANKEVVVRLPLDVGPRVANLHPGRSPILVPESDQASRVHDTRGSLVSEANPS